MNNTPTADHQPQTADPTAFRETEIGPIPADWGIAALDQIVDFSRKPRSLDLSQFAEIPFIPMELISDSGDSYHGYALRKSEDLRSGSYCEKGDILLSKITPSFENGKQAIVAGIPTDFAYATTEIYAFKPKPGAANLKYLFHYFRLPNVRSEIAKKMEGTTGRQRVPKAVIENYPIPLPPLPEQRRIAAVLSAIQDAIAAQEDVIAAARALKRSLMQRLFTYGPGREPAETQETEIGEIPVGWEVVTVDDVFDVKLGKMLSQQAKQGISSRLYMRNANVQWGYIDLTDVAEMDFDSGERERFRLRNGDILVCEGGEVGRTAIWNNELEECYYQKAIHRLRPKAGSDVLPYYFLHYMILLFLVRCVPVVEGARSTIAHIPVAKLKAVPLVMPTISEQEQIIDGIGAIDAKIAAEEDRKAALEALFRSTLHQLMTGQMRLLSDEGLPVG